MTSSLSSALDEARERLAALYGERLCRLVLFGSQARGEAGPHSDVDVLVVLRGPVEAYAEIKRLVPVETALLERYRLSFAFKAYDEETYEAPWHPLMANVREEGVEL